MAKFVYRGADRTVESVVRRSKGGGGMYDSVTLPDIPSFKVKEGESCIRILPPGWEDTDRWGDGWDIEVFLHYGVGPDNSRYLCLDKMKNEPCPVCEARLKAVDKEESDQMRPRGVNLCWVIDRDNEKAGPQVWFIPKTLYREINTRSVDKKNDTPILIDDPEEGYDVVFHRAGTTMTNTKYTGVEVSRDATPLNDDQKLEQRWLAYIQDHALPDVLNYYDAAHIEKVLFGKAVAKEETEEVVDEDGVITEQPVRGSRSASRRPVVEEEEAEPVSRNGRARQAVAEEEEPVEPRSARRRALLDEGDAEAEPTPARRGRAAPEEPVEEVSPVASARRSLERLKTRSQR